MTNYSDSLLSTQRCLKRSSEMAALRDYTGALEQLEMAKIWLGDLRRALECAQHDRQLTEGDIEK